MKGSSNDKDITTQQELSIFLEETDTDTITGGEPGQEQNKPTRCWKRVNKWLRQYLFLWLNILGVLVGFGLAFALRPLDISNDALMWLGLPGDLFMRLLKVTIVPIIAANVITGSSSVDPASNGRAGVLVLMYTIVCNFFGSGLGLLLAFVFKPGVGVGNVDTKEKVLSSRVETQDIFVDLIRNLIPDNVMQATMQKIQTSYKMAASNGDNQTEIVYVKYVEYVQGVNIIGLLFFCVVFGIAVGVNKAQPVQIFFKSCADVMITVLGWFVWTTPVGVCSLILVAILQVPDLEKVLLTVIIFFAIVVGGVIFQELFVYTCIHFAVFRCNPFKVLVASARAWAIAFASSSSSCAMPEIFHVAEQLGCDRSLTSLTIPVSVTLNASGSSLFIGAAVVFLAQATDITLSSGQYAVIWTLTALSSMVLPSVPSASIVTVLMIITILGIPTTTMGLLFTVEWFLDRIRTTCNVVCEIYGVTIIDHYCRKKAKTIQEDTKDQLV